MNINTACISYMYILWLKINLPGQYVINIINHRQQQYRNDGEQNQFHS